MIDRVLFAKIKDVVGPWFSDFQIEHIYNIVESHIIGGNHKLYDAVQNLDMKFDCIPNSDLPMWAMMLENMSKMCYEECEKRGI